MKKVLGIALVLCLLAGLFVPAAYAFALGDVNNDGAVGADDARLALRRSVDLETYAPGSEEFTAADYDGDGAVSAMDARAILRASVGLDAGVVTNDGKLKNYYTANTDVSASEYALTDFDGDGVNEMLIFEWACSGSSMLTSLTLSYYKVENGAVKKMSEFVFDNAHFMDCLLPPATEIFAPEGYEAAEVFRCADALAFSVYEYLDGDWTAHYLVLTVENGHLTLQKHLYHPGSAVKTELYRFADYYSAFPAPLYSGETAGEYPSYAGAINGELGGYGFAYAASDSYEGQFAVAGKAAAEQKAPVEALFAFRNYSTDGLISKEDAVQLVQDAVNRTKDLSGTVNVRHTESFTFTIDSMPGSSVAKSRLNIAIAGLVEPTQEDLTFKGGKAVNSKGETVPLLLPKRQAFSLSPDGVQSFSVEQTDGKTYVTLTLVPETVNKRGQVPEYNAGAIGYLSFGDLDLSMVRVDAFEVNYPGSEISVRIDARGYVEFAQYTVPVQISGSGSAVLVSGDFASHGTQTETWLITGR